MGRDRRKSNVTSCVTNYCFQKVISKVTILLLKGVTVMMSQRSGDPFAALIKVNTVVQAMVGNGNRDIRGETRAEYQGRQEGQKAGR